MTRLQCRSAAAAVKNEQEQVEEQHGKKVIKGIAKFLLASKLAAHKRKHRLERVTTMPVEDESG